MLFKGIICLNFGVELKENGKSYCFNAKTEKWHPPSKTEGLQLLRQSTTFLSMKLKNKIIIIIFAGSICAAVEFFGIKFTRIFQPQADIWCVKLQYKLLMIGKN